MATYQELRTRSQQVRDEQNIGGNTALRVGQLLMDIVKYFNDNDEAASEYLQQHFAMVNDGTQLLNWQQSPIVILHTMGETYDDGDWSALSQGENFFRNGFIIEADGQGGGINGETPKANVLYVNLANDTLYTWNGSSFDAITSGGGGGSISGDDIIKNAYYSNGNLVLIIETEGGDKTVTIPVNFDASNYVPTSRTVNGKALSSNITLSQSDIPGLVAALAAKVGYSDDEWLQVKAGAMQAATAVPNTTTVNGKQLNGNIVIGMADIPGLLQAIANAGSGAVSVQQNADGSFSITVGNDTYVFDDYPTKQDMADAIDDALGEAQVTVVPAGSVGVISSLGSDSDEDALSASMGKKLKVAIITVLNSLGNYAFPGGKPTIDWGDSSSVTYTVTYPTDSKITHSGAGDTVELGSSLEVTLGIASGNDLYVIKDSGVKVYMSGVEQSGAYNASTQKVTLAAVTGNVVIVAEAWTYVDGGDLKFFLDGKNRGVTTGHWVDLVGGIDFTLGGQTENADHVAFDGGSSSGGEASTSASLDVDEITSTVEAVYELNNDLAAGGYYNILRNKTEGKVCIGFSKGSSPYNYIYGLQSTKASTPLTCFSPALCANTSTEYMKGYLSLRTKAFVSGGTLSRAEGGYFNGNRTLQSNTGATLGLADRLMLMKSAGAHTAGKVYAVRVYSRRLTDDEILQNYAIDQKRFNLS